MRSFLEVSALVVICDRSLRWPPDPMSVDRVSRRLIPDIGL